METIAEAQPNRRSPARWSIAALVVAIALFAVGSWWWTGGARLDDGAFNGGMPTAPGETRYAGHMLSSDGPIELRSARVGTIKGAGPGDLDVEVVLIVVEPSQTIPLGTSDISEFEQLPIAGVIVDGPIERSRHSTQLLMVSATPQVEGAWRIRDLEVTYRTGNRPLRTTVVDLNLCLLATNGEIAQPLDGSPAPGVDAADWEFYQSCLG